MTNTRNCEVLVTISTGEVTVAGTVGNIMLISEKGEKLKLLKVLHVPNKKRKLLSTNRFTQAGAELYTHKERTSIQKDKMIFMLESTGQGNNKISCLRAKQVREKINNVAKAGENTSSTGAKRKV